MVLMVLSEYIIKRRTDRLDEWSMDNLSGEVKKLEDRIKSLEDVRDEIIADIRATGGKTKHLLLLKHL